MRSIRTIDKDIRDIFENIFEYPTLPLFLDRYPNLDKNSGLRLIAPKVDMYEENDSVVVKAELPGVDKKNIIISIDNGILTIKGEIKKEENVNNEDYHYSERSYGSFARHLRVPGKIDAGNVKANFKDGILIINMPVSKKAKEKEVKIEVK